jgi:hypothetical protein
MGSQSFLPAALTPFLVNNMVAVNNYQCLYLIAGVPILS